MAMLKMLVIIAIAVITAPAVVGALANHYNPFAEFDNVSDEKLAVHKNLRSDVNKAALTGNKEAKFVVSQARRTTFSASNGTHRGHTASLNGEGIFESTTSRRLLDEGPMSDDDIVITLQKYANLNAGKRHNGKTRSGKFVAIVATDSSPAFEMLIANWACNLRRVGLHPLVWALDQATHLKLNRQQIGKVPIGSIFSQRLLSLQTPEVQALWQQSVNADKLPGESAYIAAVAFKPLVMYEVVRLGFDLLYLDVDIGLANDPRPWLLNNFRMHESDIQISLNYPFVDLVNTGVVYAPTSQPGAHFLLQLWVNHMQAQKCQGWECGDQEILSQVFSKNCKNWTRLRHDDAANMNSNLAQTIFCVDSRGHKTAKTGRTTVHIDVLPPSHFATGDEESFRIIDNDNIVTFHANFGGVNADKASKLKKAKFHKMKMWCLGETKRSSNFASNFVGTVDWLTGH